MVLEFYKLFFLLLYDFNQTILTYVIYNDNMYGKIISHSLFSMQ